MSSGSGYRRGISASDVADYVKSYYAYLVLGLLFLFMFWIRIRPMDRFQGNDPIQWQAVDPYYHWRSTEWIVRNFPFTMPFEVFTAFPTGRYVGQFGTIFDQFIATLAMIIGLGSPGSDDIVLAALIGVPLIAAAVAIPVYLMGKRVGGAIGALAGVAILALTPGQFLTRTTAGMFQHHGAEVLMMAISVLALIVALQVVRREQPVWELVLDRDWDALKRPFLYSAAVGLALGFYVWVWPPAIMLIGILGIFFVVAIVIEHVRAGGSPEPIAFLAIVSMLVAAAMTLLLLQEWSTSVTSRGYLQPAGALLVAVGAAFMAGVSRIWNQRNLNPLGYPAAIAVAGLVGLGLLYLVQPGFLETLIDNVTSRLLPIDPGESTLTIAEAQPPDDPGNFFYEQVGFAFYTMVLGLGFMVARPFFGRKYRVEHTLLLVWSLLLVSMSVTQIRFSYYLPLAVAVVNAYLVTVFIDWVELPDLEAITDIKGYQVLALILVVVVLFIPLTPQIATVSAWDVSDAAYPSNDGQVWAESNLFLADNTPEVGNWGDADNADELDYWGTYGHPGDAGYDYPEGSYGVMSWWDYGHLITTHAERIPHSNPFQANARSSAHYLLSGSEEAANLHLDAIEATGDGVNTNDPEELREILSNYDEDELDNDMRYVMVEDNMVGGKFGAMAQWTGEGTGPYTTEGLYSDATSRNLFGEGSSNGTLPTWGEEYYDTIMGTMYHQDGADLDHYRLVHESADEYSLVGWMQLGDNLHQALRLNSQLGQNFENYSQLESIEDSLRQAARNDQVIEPLGFGTGLLAWDTTVQPAIKTYERVEGATITGMAEDPDSTIVAEIEVETNAERTFTYRNVVEPNEDGSFEITVPYASEHDLSVEDGYTESAVETGDYVTISEFENLDEETIELAEDTGSPLSEVAADNVTYQGTVNVSETDIYEGNELTVDMAEAANFELSDIRAPEPATVNESFEIEVDVTNTGGIIDEQDVIMTLDGDELDTQTLELEAGASETLTFEHNITEAGEIELTFETLDDERTVTIEAVNASNSSASIRLPDVLG